MPREDRLKKVHEAGSDFIETARARAEEFLKELSKASGTTQKQAQETLEDLLDGSRKGTEQVLASIRKEVATQLSSLGIATKQDLADLEARLAGTKRGGSASPAAATTTKTAAKKAPAKAAASAKKAPAKKATKAAAKKATGGA